jgi:hypothetical protein
MKVRGSSRLKQVCDALRCPGLHVRYNDTANEFIDSNMLMILENCIVIGIDYCNY